jgi:hypothetical protein
MPGNVRTIRAMNARPGKKAVDDKLFVCVQSVQVGRQINDESKVRIPEEDFVGR